MGEAEGVELRRAQRAGREKGVHRRAARAVLAAFDDYHPGVPLVFGVDFGHTDPQYVLPYGSRIVVDAVERRVFVSY